MKNDSRVHRPLQARPLHLSGSFHAGNKGGTLLKPTSTRIFIAALILSTAAQALAHDTWLAPARFQLKTPASVTLSLSSGMEFPKLDHAIKPDRIAVAKLRTGAGKSGDLPAGVESSSALTFRARAAKGVTTFWVVLNPRPSELKPEQVREYVGHLGIADPERTLAAWEQKGSTKLAYRYIKYAKAFVRAGRAGGARAWSQPAGMRLELVPETDPTRVGPGSTLRFLLLDQGKPRGRYPVSVIHAGATSAFRTDAEGHVAVEVPTPGTYLVRATTLEASAAPDTEWDVHFTTLAFEAQR